MPATATRKTLAVMVLIPVVVALALWAFAWPAARIAPRDLPIGVAGPATATAPLEQRLAAHDGAFEVHRYDSEAAARTAIEDRAVYGAVIVTPQGPELLTASAASPVVAGLLREAVAAQAPPGTQVKVTDVVATPAGDPRGSAFGASLFPLVLAGAASGIVVTVLGLRRGRATLALLGAAALAGVVGASLADSWLGALSGYWWTEAGVLGLTVFAIGATIAGLAALIGKPGLGLGALLMVLLGNPFSGVASAPELLPVPAGALGQWLPPGAGGTALRSVAFFDGAGAGAALLVLAIWAAAGTTALLVGGRRDRAAALPASAPAAPEAAPVG
ncbi:ABC transporter permease [Streptomyces sp. Je 1-79]|uniref:ABC transporter permease n=1 Tax=Streptomyces sp. Je 1-79 TaxID=2943847 RepID=UPI0021A62F6F|nr:ABC transporter permease [Streptomyces sp. Je 1-79]MCT4353673.1 ABC transporter permease [Streptomyces sp. Je 1-79]